MNEITVSVIICCYTEERLKDIHEAVESVLAQTLKPHEIIIAVDHNKQLYEILKSYYLTAQLSQPAKPPQQTQPTPETPQTKVVLNEGAQGLSETRNVGIRAASGDIVAFIDDDAVADRDWLLYLTKPFEDARIAAVGGRAVPLWPSGARPFWLAEELDWIVGCTYKGLPVKALDPQPRALNPELRTIRNVLGCNMTFRKSVFETAGLFTSDTGRVGTTTGCGEEADLCLRISHAMPEALIVHEDRAAIQHKVTPQRTTLRHLWQRSYNEGFYKARVQKLHQATQQTLSTQQTQETLSTEGSYLRYLLFRSIPDRLSRFHKKGRLWQTGAIIISITATAMGYIWGRLRG